MNATANSVIIIAVALLLLRGSIGVSTYGNILIILKHSEQLNSNKFTALVELCSVRMLFH